jgi:hypothetical protein
VNGNQKKYLLIGLCIAATIGFLIFNNDAYELRKELISVALQEKTLLDNIALFSADVSGRAVPESKTQKRNFLLCADSDGGIVPDVRGAISLSYTFHSGKTKVRKFSDLNLRHKGMSGIAEFYCEENHPKVKFIECERESKGVCKATPEMEAASLDISAGISSDGMEYSKRSVIIPEDSYVSVNTPVYYKVVIENLSENASADVEFTHIPPAEETAFFGSVQNEKIICPSGTICEGNLSEGISVSDLFPSEQVIITFERDIANSNAEESFWIEKFEIDTGSSDAVTLHIEK